MSDDVVREKLRLYADDVVPVHLPSFGGVTDRRRRRRTRQLLSATSTLVVVVLVVVLAAVVGGGSGSSRAGSLSSELSGGKWSLDSITTAGVVWKAPAGNGFSLSFTGTAYTGNDSCNGTSGKVSYGTGTVHLGPGAMTELGCLGADQAKMQDAFRQLIDKDLPASVAGGVLTLTAGQDVFSLVRVQPPAPVDLSKALPGTTWNLISIGTTGKDVSSSSPVPASVHANIAFRTHDFQGSDGCNTHTGSVAYTAQTLAFSNPAGSLAACGTATSEISLAYGKVLTGTVSPTLVGDTLTIANGAQSLVLTKALSGSVAGGLAQKLTANKWTLVSVVDGGLTLDLSSHAWQLVLTATSYSAQTECFNATGAVTYAGGVLDMAWGGGDGHCAETALDTRISKDYQQVFNGTVTYQLTDGGLVLSAGGTSLSYVAGGPTGVTVTAGPTASAVAGIPDLEATLVGPTWKLLTLKTATDSWHAIAASTASLTFTAKGYQASDGCNSEGTDVVYDAQSDSVDVTRGGDGSQGSCSFAGPGPPAGTLPPQAFFDALLGPLQVALSGDTLRLSRTGVVLTFSKQAPDQSDTYPAVTSDPAGTALEKQLAASTWRLNLQSKQKVTLVFGVHGFVVDDGTNAYDGAITYLGGQLVMRLVSTTGAGTAAPSASPGSLAATFHALFSGAVPANVTPGLLELAAGGQSTLWSAGPPPAEPLTLNLPTPEGAAPVDANTVNLEQLVAGRKWMLSSLVMGGTSLAKASTLGAYLTLSGAGFHLDDGCNEGDGPATYAGQTITFGLYMESAALCPSTEDLNNAQSFGFQSVTYNAVVTGPKLTLTSPSRTFVYLAAGTPGAPSVKQSLP